MTIRLRFEGMKLESLNRRNFGASKGAAMARASKIKAVRRCVELRIREACGPLTVPLRTIRIVRISAGVLDDDNFCGSLKPALDGVATALGLNDRTFVIVGERPGVRVLPSQRSEGKGVFAVELELDFDERPGLARVVGDAP